MEKVMGIIITNIVISIGIYFVIATVLVLINGKAKDSSSHDNKLAFDELDIDYEGLPSLEVYKCRDGVQLDYRYYFAQSNKVLILLHGSGWHSKYFFPIAKALSSENSAHIYTPDLRGHGINPARRGDISYINQLEDDVADFIKLVREKHPNSKIIIGGHSSGGGLAIRFAGSQYGHLADAYLLLSPFLKYNAPTMKANSGGWASTHMPRIIGLSMLNNVKVSWLNYLHVIDFNMPKAYRDGTETLSYSYRLNTGFAPRDYRKDLSQIKQPLLAVIGKSDESFVAEAFLPEISKYKNDLELTLLEDVTHMGVVVGDQSRPHIEKWIMELN